MLADVLAPECTDFAAPDESSAAMREACAASGAMGRLEAIGESEQGREIIGLVIGRGERRVSLIAGNHPDEPVGPQTLRHFVVRGLAERERLGDLLDRFTFCVVPHVNPDGEAANRGWVEQWPNPLAYLAGAVREPPGRDVEFGYPAMRPENRAVADFLAKHGPFVMHASLHGMAVAEGAWLLIDRHWVERTQRLRQRWAEAVEAAGLRLFDWDRGGDKGFEYIGPGFSTTPRGDAMRAHFEAAGDRETAKLFHQSSMEYVRELGGDPLCLVTELPLFVLTGRVADPRPGVPMTYLKFRDMLPELRRKVERGAVIEDIIALVEPFGIEPLPLETAMRLQLTAIELGLREVSGF